MGELLVIFVILVVFVVVLGPVLGSAVAALTAITCKIQMNCIK